MKNFEGPIEPNEDKQKEAERFVSKVIKELRERNEALRHIILGEGPIGDREAITVINGLRNLVGCMEKSQTESKELQAEYSKIMENPRMNQLMIELFITSHSLISQGILKVHDSFLNLNLDNQVLENLEDIIRYFRYASSRLEHQPLEQVLTDLDIWIADRER